MKKTILIEFLLLFVTAIQMYYSVHYWSNVSLYIENQIFNDGYSFCITAAILFMLSTLATIAAIILIALKDFKPLADKLQARKVARQEAKAEKAEADKQAKISELEKQLEELKNN